MDNAVLGEHVGSDMRVLNLERLLAAVSKMEPLQESAAMCMASWLDNVCARFLIFFGEILAQLVILPTRMLTATEQWAFFYMAA